MIDVRLERSGTVLRCWLPDELAPALAGLRHYRMLRTGGDADHEVSVTDARTAAFRYRPTETGFAAPVRELSAAGLQVVVDQGFFRALDAAGKVVLHASAVSDGRRVWALWGSSGAGKTTLALALHREAGWALVSNGSLLARMVDGQPCAVGTVKRHVKLRTSSLRDSSSRPVADATAAGSSAAPADGSGSAGYEDKREADLGEFGADHVTLPLPLERLIFVRLVAALPDALTTRIDPRRAAVQLYEDMVRHLHGGEAVVFSRDGAVLAPVPSATNEAGHRHRVHLVEALTARATALTGPLDACLALLARSPVMAAQVRA